MAFVSRIKLQDNTTTYDTAVTDIALDFGHIETELQALGSPFVSRAKAHVIGDPFDQVVRNIRLDMMDLNGDALFGASSFSAVAMHAFDKTPSQLLIDIIADMQFIEGFWTQPTIAINDVTLTEGNSGSTNAVFTVSLSNAYYLPISFDFTTVDGTATVANNDYTLTAGTAVSIPSGSSTYAISVPIIGDTNVEPDENFTVALSNPVNATIADASGLGTIQDDGDVFDPDTINWGATYVADAVNVDSAAAIGQWNDTSGNAQHATQASTAAKAVLDTTTNLINGHPVVHYDGVEDIHITPLGFLNPLGEIWVVGRINGTGNNGHIIGAAGSTAVKLCHLLDGVTLNSNNNGVSVSKAAATGVPFAARIGLHHLSNPADHPVLLDVNNSGAPVTAIGNGVVHQLALGSWGSWGVYTNCDIAEVRYSPTRLTAQQVADMWSHVNSRYAL